MANRNHDDERNRALFYALVVTFVVLVLFKILFGLFWYSAVVIALIVFGLTFALILRLRRHDHH